jgi:cysteine synthase A
MSAIDAVGRTPVVRLERPVGDDSAEVWVKLEGANPTGSYKDRMALAMIEAAERDGRLVPGQSVVEYTGGSTGSSLAFVCAVRGYPLRIVSSDAFAPEKISTMRAFGAEVELISSPQGITPDLIGTMVARAREIASGTAGRTSSTTPTRSTVLSGGTPVTHHIEGGGIGMWPPMLASDDIDQVIAVPEAAAFSMARQAATIEGVFSGPSTGANLIAALEIARSVVPAIGS